MPNRAVAKAGAWAIKFQHHIAEEETTDYAQIQPILKGIEKRLF